MPGLTLQSNFPAVRRYLAWKSILAEKESLDLSSHNVKQTDVQRAANGAVAARIPEAYHWLLVPVQTSPQDIKKPKPPPLQARQVA